MKVRILFQSFFAIYTQVDAGLFCFVYFPRSLSTLQLEAGILVANPGCVLFFSVFQVILSAFIPLHSGSHGYSKTLWQVFEAFAAIMCRLRIPLVWIVSLQPD